MDPTLETNDAIANASRALAASPGLHRANGIEDVMEALSRVSVELLESYRKLAARAERMEQELCRTNAELERILESLPTGVVVRNAAGHVVRTNRALRSILGLAEGELEASGAHAALDGVGDEWVERELCLDGGRPAVLAGLRSPIQLDPNAEGGAGSIQIVEDRTELARLSQRLHALDKLASLGNMAGGIAHELRNPMNAVRGFAALLLRRLEDGTREREWAAMIVEGVDEANTILSSMLTIAAPESLVREAVDGEELVPEAVALAARDVVGGPEAQADPDADERWIVVSSAELPRFEGDRIKLRQALRNLLANAMQAQPEGGEVHVSLDLEDADVVLRVADAGPGIPPELAGRVFDPFFTTRAEGTGLGLALVGTIAQLHGGRVDVSRAPEPLGGAEVTVRIPFNAAD